MRSRPVLALLAASTLFLAACGGGDDEAGDGVASPTAGATTDAGEGQAAELEEGVAAVVDGDEIPTDLLSSRVEAAAASPQVAEILEGEEGDAARAQLQASILSQLIVNEIVLTGAEERGLDVDEAAVETTREELTTQAGGAEAFDAQVSEAGLDEGQLTSELEALTALRLVREDLSAESGSEGASPAPPVTAPDGSTVEPADVLLQQWLLERLQAAEIAVAPAIGSWDPAQGMVVPPVVTPELEGGGPTSGPTSGTDAETPSEPASTATPSPATG